VRNHANGIVACDFFTTVTVGFRVLYVFVVLEVGTRRILHWNVTKHPTAAWTIQQFRAVITPKRPTGSYSTIGTASIRQWSTWRSRRWDGMCSKPPRGYNPGRPHASLGPGFPHPLPDADQLVSTGHRLPEHTEVIATPILGGLHHEYRLARRAA
jgi:putative transposase